MLIQPAEVEWEWRVSDLIDWQEHKWDKERIEASFHMFDAEAILKILLSRRLVQDSIIWIHTKNGKYSVKSGYHIAKQLKLDDCNDGECSSQRVPNQIWTKIWKANVPNKIKVFPRKASKNALPTLDNLLHRRVIENATCNFCQRDEETILHALWGCGAAQDVWAGSVVCFQKCGTVFHDFRKLVEEIMVKKTAEDVDLFLVTCWQIWYQRNVVLRGGVLHHPSRLNRRTMDYLQEYCDALDHLVVTGSSLGEVTQAW